MWLTVDGTGTASKMTLPSSDTRMLVCTSGFTTCIDTFWAREGFMPLSNACDGATTAARMAPKKQVPAQPERCEVVKPAPFDAD